MPLAIALLVLSFAVLVGGAFVFTNAVEWAGSKLNLGHGAVGSVLAAVATAMPESLIPIIAIVSGEQGGEIAVGAILGAPFLLGTLAMALCGISALVFRARRERVALDLDRPAMVTDLAVFLGAFAVAVGLGAVGSRPVRIAGAVLLLLVYAGYTWRTLRRGREEGGDEQPPAMYFDPSKQDPPSGLQLAAQLVAGVLLMVGGAELFVTQVEHIAKAVGVDALVLALVLAPLASELPEKINSVLWIRRGKDTLALGNITGAMVFQCTIPVGVGLAFTSWSFTAPAWTAGAAALAGGALALVPALRGGRFGPPLIALWLALYLGAVAAILTVS
ncbi:sodium:calcium antiporter [Actinomadura macrotermitis]|uniref:Sodium/calcium exchanger membrane region domain-containing protein n=1 Tax=Actinomadura macrotermitis TaxID=2585200 RepID=A0A7K0BTF5_9ACTN|nr:sodium:calcium antiporter [Actinomadura macrotermitis]MQY04427.1 hypothetical protein [Actinomadura macrotermitis]